MLREGSRQLCKQLVDGRGMGGRTTHRLCTMAAREHGDMPLGARPFLPQFADSRPVARPKRQIFQAGGEIREPEAEAFDPSAHVSPELARADSAAVAGRSG